MSGFSPDTAWQVVRPGVLGLPTTGVTIKYDERSCLYIVLTKNGVGYSATATLLAAKQEGCRLVREMLEMGLEP